MSEQTTTVLTEISNKQTKQFERLSAVRTCCCRCVLWNSSVEVEERAGRYGSSSSFPDGTRHERYPHTRRPAYIPLRRLQISVAALVATPSGFWPEQSLKPLGKMPSFMYGGEKKAADIYTCIYLYMDPLHSGNCINRLERKEMSGLERQTINYLDEIVTSSEYKLPEIDRLSQRCHLFYSFYTIVMYRYPQLGYLMHSRLFFSFFFFFFSLTISRRASRCGCQSHVPKFPDHQRQQNGKKKRNSIQYTYSSSSALFNISCID